MALTTQELHVPLTGAGVEGGGGRAEAWAARRGGGTGGLWAQQELRGEPLGWRLGGHGRGEGCTLRRPEPASSLDGVPGRRDFELFQSHKRSPLGETHSMSLSVRARDCQHLM